MHEITGYRINYQNLQYEDVVSLFDLFAVGYIGTSEVIAVSMTGERNYTMIFMWTGVRYKLVKKSAHIERPLNVVELKQVIKSMNEQNTRYQSKYETKQDSN